MGLCVMTLAVCGTVQAQDSVAPSLSDFGVLTYWAGSCQMDSDLVPRVDVEASLGTLVDVSLDTLGPDRMDAEIRTAAWPLLMAGPDESCPLVEGLYGPQGSHHPNWLELNPVRAAELRTKLPSQPVDNTAPELPQPTSEQLAQACSSMESLLAAGDRLISDLRADNSELVVVGSEHHKSMLALQNLAAGAMADTWAANWQAVDSWFPTIRAINYYANNDFPRGMASKVLSVFVTARPEVYDAPSSTIGEMVDQNAWIPGEFLKMCQPAEETQ